MTPSETPIQPDYTPMSVTGELIDLQILSWAIGNALNNLQFGKNDRTIESLLLWREKLNETLSDQRFEHSLNHLPFPEK